MLSLPKHSVKSSRKSYWMDLYWIVFFCQTIHKPLLDSTDSKTRCQESVFHDSAPISHTEKHTITGFRGVKSNEVLQTPPNSDGNVSLLLAAVLPWAASQIKPSSHLLLFCWSLKSFHWETTAPEKLVLVCSCHTHNFPEIVFFFSLHGWRQSCACHACLHLYNPKQPEDLGIII